MALYAITVTVEVPEVLEEAPQYDLGDHLEQLSERAFSTLAQFAQVEGYGWEVQRGAYLRTADDELVRAVNYAVRGVEWGGR